MAKKNIHYIGFLANVDDSIMKLQLGDGFLIEKSRSQSDVMPFLRRIDFYWGVRGRDDISPQGCYRVVKPDIAKFESTAHGGVAIDPGVCQKAHTFIQNKLRLLRLFKEGNIVPAYSFLHHVKGSEPAPFSAIREYPIADRTPFTLTTAGLSEAQSFIETVSLPLREPLHLAFTAFELSYETYDPGLAFLSLMVAMEVMLNPSGQELRYRISRNAGVLLGRSPSDGEAVFREMKRLYDKRSKLVHTGDRSAVTHTDILRLRHHVRQTIKEAMRSGMSKDKLLNAVNACGFGQRPWRSQQ